MHMPSPTDTTATSTYSNKPTADDLTASMMIPNRTSSITSTTSTFSTLTPSRSTSRCSSINSGFSYTGSLDHRTMHRPSTPSSTHKSNSSISSSTTMPPPTSPVQRTSSESSDSPATTTVTVRRPSVVERTAFLASAPIRSRAQISPRLKNMCPAPSASSLCTASTTLFSNTSLPSLTSRCFSSFQTNNSSCWLMNPGGVSLEKRRWSNDSTRGLYGGVESTTSSGTLSFLSNDDGRISTSSSSEGGSTSNEEENNKSSKKKKSKKVKKPCPSLALFNFMLKK
ncbi:hypothetical protein BGZ47_005823 [Haplosporangium gracile]|nr:hypothetical protein BGZ47_005823 [Haplosporangium gracile]